MTGLKEDPWPASSAGSARTEAGDACRSEPIVDGLSVPQAGRGTDFILAWCEQPLSRTGIWTTSLAEYAITLAVLTSNHDFSVIFIPPCFRSYCNARGPRRFSRSVAAGASQHQHSRQGETLRRSLPCSGWRPTRNNDYEPHRQGRSLLHPFRSDAVRSLTVGNAASSADVPGQLFLLRTTHTPVSAGWKRRSSSSGTSGCFNCSAILTGQPISRRCAPQGGGLNTAAQDPQATAAEDFDTFQSPMLPHDRVPSCRGVDPSTATADLVDNSPPRLCN